MNTTTSTSRILGEAKRKVSPPTEEELTDPRRAYYYAINVIGGRWPEAEATIAKSPDYAKFYLEAFPEAKLEWAMNGLIDWLDL